MKHALAAASRGRDRYNDIMAHTSAAALSEPALDRHADARVGLTMLGIALSARWLIALLLLSGGVLVGNQGTLSQHDWLILVQGRAFVDVILAAVTTAGAFAFTRGPHGIMTPGGFGLRLLALADLSFAFSLALESPLLPPFASARLVAMTALVHASFAYVALRHLGGVCARAGEHGASAWARAGGWAFVVASVLALGSTSPEAWVALGLTVPMTNPALPAVILVAVYVTLRARRAVA